MLQFLTSTMFAIRTASGVDPPLAVESTWLTNYDIDENPDVDDMIGTFKVLPTGLSVTIVLTDDADGAFKTDPANGIGQDGTVDLVVADATDFDFEVNPTLEIDWTVSSGHPSDPHTLPAPVTITINDVVEGGGGFPPAGAVGSYDGDALTAGQRTALDTWFAGDHGNVVYGDGYGGGTYALTVYTVAPFSADNAIRCLNNNGPMPSVLEGTEDGADAAWVGALRFWNDRSGATSHGQILLIINHADYGAPGRAPWYDEYVYDVAHKWGCSLRFPNPAVYTDAYDWIAGWDGTDTDGNTWWQWGPIEQAGPPISMGHGVYNGLPYITLNYYGDSRDWDDIPGETRGEKLGNLQIRSFHGNNLIKQVAYATNYEIEIEYKLSDTNGYIVVTIDDIVVRDTRITEGGVHALGLGGGDTAEETSQTAFGGYVHHGVGAGKGVTIDMYEIWEGF